MTERKKPRGKKAADSMKVDDPPTKTEKAIIHWVRKNVPTKKTKFLHSHVVNYFMGSKAVDALVRDSPWSPDNAKEGSEYIFDCRERAVEFMDLMLKHKMFHRATKIPVNTDKKKKAKTKSKDKDGNKTDTDRETSPRATKNSEKDNDDEKNKRKKRKIRLDMHLEQIFLDSNDAFVWLYDPIPWYYWIGGSAIVLGIIAVCLFPLWPPIMRQGVHYLSIAAAGSLIFIIALGVVKYIIFAILFALSGGKLKFWIFPNLTEDVGFFESFKPAYDYTYTGGKKKAKDSDDEEEDDEEEEEEEEDESKEAADNTESEDSSSRKSSTGKDFEMVDKENNTEDDG